MTEPNENVQSQLSAFVDNELPQDETQLLARRLSRDSGLQQSLNRYLLIGEALRSPKQTPVSRNLSSRVAAALEQYNEPQGDTAVVVKPVKAKASWAKTALGMSLAASVAAIAMVAFYGMQSPVNGGADSEVAMNDSSNQLSSAPADSYVVPVATTTPSVPISAARLTNYVVAHSEFTSPLGRRNTMTGLVTGDQQTEAVEETVDTAATGTGK